ncbi:MAG: ribonuclease Z [Bacteroidales bacterium]
MGFKLTILGTNSASPTSSRLSSSQLLDTGKHLFLLDCAEGTQIQMRRFKIRFNRIEHIFITHLHGDHYYGLIGLLTTFHLLGRSKSLHIYAVPELKEVIEIQLKVSNTTLIYPLEFHFLDPTVAKMIYEDKFVTVQTLPLLHRIPTCGFLFREKPKPRKILKSAIADKDIPVEAFTILQHGDDFINADGRIYKNQDFTTSPEEVVSYAYCTDTAYYEPLIDQIRNISCLFHESTFLEKEASLAFEKQHSTASQAARIAKRARAGKLILGHFSSRYKDLSAFLHEASEVFPNTELAEEGITFNIENKI